MVRTWSYNALLGVCVHVEPSCRRVHEAELAAQLRVVSVSATSQFPLSILVCNPTLLRVISDNTVDEGHFLVDSSLPKSSYHAITKLIKTSRMFETTAIFDFLLLRLKRALYEPWMEDVPALQRAVVAGAVEFDVVAGLISIWDFVHENVRYTGPRHIKSTVDRVIQFVFGIVCVRVFLFPSVSSAFVLF